MAPYIRLYVIVAVSVFVMFVASYVSTVRWDHVFWSEMSLYRAVIMGALMLIVMLISMREMYPGRQKRIATLLVAGVILFSGVALLRSQFLVQDQAWLQAMIPHHSTAILTSERARLSDVRVQELAEEIRQTQEEEIHRMKWLLEDIRQRGPARTGQAAEARSKRLLNHNVTSRKDTQEQ